MQVLEGIKVVDLSTAYSAPIATMQLADFGAEVIKIENTAGGDGSRSWNPSVNGQGIHFLYMNRNKKSVALNLKSPEGKRILFELVKDADIVVENFRPGVTRRLGIDYEAMRAVKPDIIMASLSGYGQTGPYATRGAYSNLAEALSGLMYVTGWPAPEGKPTASGVALRRQCGRHVPHPGHPVRPLPPGAHRPGPVHRRIHGGLPGGPAPALLRPVLPDGPGAGADRQPGPVRLPLRSLRGQGRLLPVGQLHPRDWSRFAQAIGRPDLGEDPAYKTSAQRWAHIGELHDIIQDWASQRTRKEIEAIFTEYGQLYAPVLKISEVMQDEQILFREMVVDMEYEGMGKYKDKGIPVKMSRTPGRIRSMPPHLGEHTDAILSGLAIPPPSGSGSEARA